MFRSILHQIRPFYPSWVVLAVLISFWMAGIYAAAYFAAIPCVKIEVGESGKVQVIRTFPFRIESNLFLSQEIGSIDIIKSKDIDGDPYYELHLHVARLSVVIAEGSDRGRLEKVRAEFMAAIGCNQE